MLSWANPPSAELLLRTRLRRDAAICAQTMMRTRTPITVTAETMSQTLRKRSQVAAGLHPNWTAAVSLLPYPGTPRVARIFGALHLACSHPFAHVHRRTPVVPGVVTQSVTRPKRMARHGNEHRPIRRHLQGSRASAAEWLIASSRFTLRPSSFSVTGVSLSDRRSQMTIIFLSFRRTGATGAGVH